MSHKKNYFLCFLHFSTKTILLSFCIYLLIVLIGGYFWTINPTELNSNQAENQTEIEIYITSNGFHSDVVIPIQTETNFFKILNQDSFINSYLGNTNSYKWLSIGWGDKGFYKESYNGNFPSVSSCLNAALVPSETLMHLDFYRNNLKESKNCKKIKLKKGEYQSLLQHIVESFRTVKKDSKNKITKFIRLPQKGYSNSDYFFEAKGSYHLFYTCNSWTNEGLQKANQKTALFAPLAQTILYHLK
ncbi:Protein of unknown function (DUF2459) [Bernardetia litoralis DSM 6794]|uniref:TIGR02117 family protein n=1 Tax=Bernardetia litoralis (strain ATCC 23117 / DSM 6794 / NBRC 15988 / NCIMB 1366 / Fx l1 / Sio-4) TaxID=880071 RepID=I4AGT8_BERLS|nr:DUF2459 domain-containing protein [Bernardetia litoralis]AFM03173.1 Protein of unknown function (DUF2459) [Bernardetia litoralis DSM 6794]